MQLEGPQDWIDWLERHYDFEPGVWLKFAKKGTGVTTVTYAEALEAALCFGWIDGMSKSFDATFYLQKFTPRRKRSMWSKINVAKVEALMAAGKVRPSGIAAVEAAQADGRWQRAYDSPANTTMPDDFKALLEAEPKVKAFYDSLSKANQYAIVWRIMTAAKPAIRQARIEKLLAMLRDGKTIH